MTQLQSTRTALARKVLGEEKYQRAIKVIGERKQRPRIGKVKFGDLRRLEPVCRGDGYDRGQPIDRFYIENFLAEHSPLITGAVLEVGERTYTERFGTGVTRSDMLNYVDHDDATYVADLTDASEIPDNSYDCIIITQTLQMIFDVRAAVTTMHRILKPGGVVLCTVPCISQIADPAWTWYWGFTELALTRLLTESFSADGVRGRGYGNVLSATSFLQGMSAREFSEQELAFVDPEYPVIVAAVARKIDVTP